MDESVIHVPAASTSMIPSPFPDRPAPRLPDGSGLSLVAGSAACLLALLQVGISRGLPHAAVESLLAISPQSWHAALMELEHGFDPDVNPDDRPTLIFLLLQVLAWIGMAGTAWHLLRRPATSRVLVILLAFAVLLRIILLPSLPVHDAMALRGLWEGKALVSGVNPTRYEPGALTAHDLGFQEPTWIDGAIYPGRPWTPEDEFRITILRNLRDAAPDDFAALPDPHLPTVSGPLVQAAFALSAAMFGNSLLAWKCLVVVFDLGSLVLLLRLLRRLGFHRSGVIVYAWSPLVLMEFASAGRPDAIPIFFVLLAISLALPGRSTAAAAVLGVAALGNLLALALAPVLFRSVRRPLIVSLALFGILAAGLAPFAGWQDAGFGPLLRGGILWAGSSPGSGQPLGGVFTVTQGLIESLLGGSAATTASDPAKISGTASMPGTTGMAVRVLLASLSCLLIGWHAFRPAKDARDQILRMFRVLGGLLVLAPAAAPWQIAWIIPFLAAFPRPSWMLLTLTIQVWFLQFPTDLRAALGPFGTFPGLAALIWLPFLGLRFADSRITRRAVAHAKTKD